MHLKKKKNEAVIKNGNFNLKTRVSKYANSNVGFKQWVDSHDRVLVNEHTWPLIISVHYRWTILC